MKNLRTNTSLAKYTTLNIGGPARYFIEVTTESELKESILYALKNKIPYLVIGGGSNLLVNDKGFGGFVIRNLITGIKENKDRIYVKTGTTLSGLVNYTVSKGLFGMQKMVRIPGTVGGAIYGNSGSYGQAIGDYILKVKVFDGNKSFWLSKIQCCFGYRDSIFKKNNYFIIEVVFKFPKGHKKDLAKEFKETLSIRIKKYPLNIKCPGSFFKNIEASTLTRGQLNTIPQDKIVYGKLPAGYLLEEVGANGMSLGEIKVADYHGNLLLNQGGGKASDFFKLAKCLKEKVRHKFKIELEPEVQLVGFKNKL